MQRCYWLGALSALALLVFVAIAADPTVAAVKLTAAQLVPIYSFASGDATADASLFRAACTSDVTIIDEFAPYQWSGPGAPGRYAADLKAWFLASGITAVHATVEDPRYIDVKNGRAWVSVPATFSFLMNGKRASESGIFTFVLAKTGGAWRAKAVAWATTSSGTEH